MSKNEHTQLMNVLSQILNPTVKKAEPNYEKRISYLQSEIRKMHNMKGGVIVSGPARTINFHNMVRV